MPFKKTHKRKKASRMHGRKMGTHGGGARKKRKGSGHRGGIGMSGSGKRADHKKTLITKKYGHGYFGRKGITSKSTKKDKRQRIKISDIDKNIEKYVANGLAKKSGDGFEINLKDYKILNNSKNYKVKNKLIIKALSASQSALNTIKSAGGNINLPGKKTPEEKIKKEVENKEENNGSS
ncbi:MAG: uL15m family ribosomal protein [Candidatus Nanoarchaeia archaeon]